MSDLPLHRTMQDDEIDRLKAQIKETEEKGRVLMDMCRDLKARCAELEQSCINLASENTEKVFSEPPMTAWLLRKQAEAVDDFGNVFDRLHSMVASRKVAEDAFEYAQRLRQKADAVDREPGQ